MHGVSCLLVPSTKAMLCPLSSPLGASATATPTTGRVATAGLQHMRTKSCWLAALEMQPSVAQEAPFPVSCCQCWGRVLCSYESWPTVILKQAPHMGPCRCRSTVSWA